jgi:hypothetical protein
MAIRIDYTQLRISNHTTYVALNPCICQPATGVLKSISGSRKPRAQIHHRPASCHGGYTLLSPPLHAHFVLSYSGLSLPEARLTHDEVCDQLKGPQSSSLHTHQSLMGLEDDERAELQTHAREIERRATGDLSIRGGNLDESELVTTLPARRRCK